MDEKPYKLKKIDPSIEKRILTNMIVSKQFLSEMSDQINPAYFQNKYAKILSEWILNYWKEYQKCPINQIQDIYDFCSVGLDGTQASLVKDLLEDISSKYSPDSEINIDYVTKQSISYFKARELEIVTNNVKYFLMQGQVEEAEREIYSLKKISRINSEWKNPFCEDSIKKVFSRKNEIFFKYPGQLGEFIGPLERGWTVAVEAPYKRGKTWFLEDSGLVGITQAKRVAFISCENIEEKNFERMYKRITATGDKEGNFLYPVFDCAHNQHGNCDLPERTNRHQLIEGEGEDRPEFDGRMPYRPCTACRNVNNQNYIKATWFTLLSRPVFEEEHVTREITGFDKLYGHMLRVRTYPRFSANLDIINRDLDLLEKKEGFVPDIIIIDHMDALLPEPGSPPTGYEKEDISWKTVSRMGGERSALVLTATQVTGEGQEANLLRTRHTARWGGKIGHVDGMLTLNQNATEKRNGVMRIGMKAFRDLEFDEERTVTLLQKFQIGQFHLDSQM